MKPEQQRIAIAEICGWTDIHGGPPEGAYWRGANPLRPDLLKEEIPDYLNDLNAMHGAEELLTEDQWNRYIQHILDEIHYEEEWPTCYLNLDAVRQCASATAAQRAEAFLKTLNKWTDDN